MKLLEALYNMPLYMLRPALVNHLVDKIVFVNKLYYILKENDSSDSISS